MEILWGILLVVLGLLAWGGQAISWFAPERAARLGLFEEPGDVEPALWADFRGEALWDTLSLWTMAAAGVLLVIDSPAWPYFGLVAGGSYVYFAGRGLATRRVFEHAGFRFGSQQSIAAGYVMLAVWGVAAGITIAAAAAALAD